MTRLPKGDMAAYLLRDMRTLRGHTPLHENAIDGYTVLVHLLVDRHVS